ncbi:MAG: ketopantoate reductase family protein [Syntrophobacteria bacterium]
MQRKKTPVGMKIAVVGPGAIGSLIAAYLASAGEDLWLLDYRSERAALLRETGIAVAGERGRFHAPVRATADPLEVGSAEILILCVKAGDTSEAAGRLQGAVSSQSHILTLQNGLGNIEKLGELFGSDRVFAGVTSHGATLLEVGNVRHAGYGEIWMGKAGEAGPQPASETRLQDLAASLNRAGLQAHIVDDIQLLVWRKLVINVGINALTAVLGVPNGELVAVSECRKVIHRAVTEAVDVAQLCGISLRSSDEIERVEEVCRSTAANISSMLQDIRRQKNTEIDQINGAVVRIAAGHDLDCPVNEVLTALVKSLEAGYSTC